MLELNIINSFGKKKILLIGDAILDVYIYGKAVCKSLDTPTIEAEEMNMDVTFGGASSVANNILELGGYLNYISIIGDDSDARYYNHFNHSQLNKIFLIENQRKTIVKKRYWIDGYKLLQMNQVDNQPINSILEEQIIKLAKSFINDIDIIVISDMQHGLLTSNIINQLIELSQNYQKPIYVDSQISHKPTNHYLYKKIDCLFLNYDEAIAIDQNFNLNSLELSLNQLKKKLDLANVVVKLGQQGSIALFKDKYIQSSSYPVKAIDTCGAGDAFLAAFSLGDRELAEESFAIANAWAALSTTMKGAIPPKKQMLIDTLKNNY